MYSEVKSIYGIYKEIKEHTTHITKVFKWSSTFGCIIIVANSPNFVGLHLIFWPTTWSFTIFYESAGHAFYPIFMEQAETHPISDLFCKVVCKSDFLFASMYQWKQYW